MNRFSIPEDPLALASFCVVMASWFIFAGIFLFRKRPPGSPERRRTSGATLGVILQGLAYGLVWTIRRNGTPLLPSAGKWLEITIELAAPLCAVCSGWLIISAIRTLGKQWAIAARVIEGHALISTGPYAVIRHPIYTGMLGMLIATGLVLSQWEALVAGIAIFSLGLEIRVRTEDRLLKEEFGVAFDEYSRRVPAILPGILRKRQ